MSTTGDRLRARQGDAPNEYLYATVRRPLISTLLRIRIICIIHDTDRTQMEHSQYNHIGLNDAILCSFNSFTSWMMHLRASTVVCRSLFDIFMRVILAERKLYTDYWAKSQPSKWGCKRCWFPQTWPWSCVGVAGIVAKIKLAYNLVLAGIPVVWTAPPTTPLGAMPEQKNRSCFMHVDYNARPSPCNQLNFAFHAVHPSVRAHVYMSMKYTCVFPIVKFVNVTRNFISRSRCQRCKLLGLIKLRVEICRHERSHVLRTWYKCCPD